MCWYIYCYYSYCYPWALGCKVRRVKKLTNNLKVISKSSHVIKVAIAHNKWWYGSTIGGEKVKLSGKITQGVKNDSRIWDVCRITDLMELLNNPSWMGKRSHNWAEVEGLAADVTDH